MSALANPRVHIVLGVAAEIRGVHQQLVQLSSPQAAGLTGDMELALIIPDW